MSIHFVDSSKTNSFKDSKGITWWENPTIKCRFNSNFEFYDLDGKLLEFKQRYVGGRFNPELTFKVLSKKTGKFITSHASPIGVYLKVVFGVEKILGKSLERKDIGGDFSKDNVRVVASGGGNNKFTYSRYDGTMYEISQEEKIKLMSKDEENLQETPMEKCKALSLFDQVKGDTKYTTEDGGVFPTKELADWHQEKVSKGKGNAQVVLDFNGGYVLAENIFKQEVIYTTKAPYENFVDVMNNNSGVTESVKDSGYVLKDGVDSLPQFVGRTLTHADASVLGEIILSIRAKKAEKDKLFKDIDELYVKVDKIDKSINNLSEMADQLIK